MRWTPIRWARKVPCLCQHSPAPAARRAQRSVERAGSEGTASASSRRNGRAAARREARSRFGYPPVACATAAVAPADSGLRDGMV
ncbi:hypothetical protein IEQ34_007131 [Dendrobium chrysotoxum]|uniref:Uncharacterized protein n=1 Tax=Dendrobium chrysotoxum TaxID=161865 RepID=A0AAV7HA15_DENCH|nr:hypothetical protein IEQ34_007131 [Dendrobium chrysotoxum]